MAPRPDPIPPFDLIVLAASAGGLSAVGIILSALPASFPVPLVLVQHRSNRLPNMLAHILQQRTALRVIPAVSGETPDPGTVYIAPPDQHLSLTPSHTFLLTGGPAIHHTHSSADPLFESVAAVYGSRVIAVVLTGGAGDAAEGARAVGLAGGIVLAQNEATSLVFSMPRATIATGQTDAVLGIEEIGPALVRLVETGKIA